MARKIKVLGLALVAVFAMSAVAASASQAAPKFTSSAGGGVNIAGEQTELNIFTTSIGVVECEVAKFAGTTSGAVAETQTIKPTYEGCAVGGAFEANIDFTGCDYLFHANGEVDVVCPSGKVIDINVPEIGCTITVGPQTVASVAYSNVNPGINVKVNVGGIDYTYDSCLGHNETRTDGTYGGAAQIFPASGVLSWDA